MLPDKRKKRRQNRREGSPQINGISHLPPNISYYKFVLTFLKQYSKRFKNFRYRLTLFWGKYWEIIITIILALFVAKFILPDFLDKLK
jgi:hypothetical protein